MARREVVNKKKVDPLEEFDAPSETPDISKSVDIVPTPTLKKPRKLRRKLRRAKSAMSSSSKIKQQNDNKQHYIDSKAVSRP